MNHLEIEHDIDRLHFIHFRPFFIVVAKLLSLSHLIYLTIRVTTYSKCSKIRHKNKKTLLNYFGFCSSFVCIDQQKE